MSDFWEDVIDAAQTVQLWPLVFYFAIVIALAGAMIAVSHVLGPRKERPGAEPYESGVSPTGSTHIRFSAQFYLVALSFLIFDLEAAFLFAWAVAAREAGWSGYLGLLVFVALLTVLLAYEWKMGALNWGPRALGLRRAASDNQGT